MALQALGIDALRERLARWAAVLADHQVPLQAALQALRQTIAESFAGQAGADGQPWPPLRPATLRAKARLGFPPDARVRTGLLRDGWEAQADAGADAGTLRSLAAYAGYLNAGTRTIPARPFVPEADQSLALVRAAYAQAVAAALDNA